MRLDFFQSRAWPDQPVDGEPEKSESAMAVSSKLVMRDYNGMSGHNRIRKDL